MKEERFIRIHPIDDHFYGYCECCANWVTMNDPESSVCTMRFLSDHSQEWRNRVREEVKKQRPHEVEDLKEIHERLRKEVRP